MYSILNRISQYVRDFGIPFKEVCVSSTYFPEYFNRVVLEELNKCLPRTENESYINEYIISFGENNELKLITYASDKRTRVVIFPGEQAFDYKIPGKKLSEYAIYQEAKTKEKNSLNEIMCFLKVKGLSNRVNINLNPFESELKKSAKLCVSYIDYCNKYYQESIRRENEEQKSLVKFITPETSTIIRKTKVNSDGTVERVNTVLSVDERKEVLESYPYLYVSYAYSKNSKEIEYLNYLYEIDNDSYAIVMEPYNGNSATKVRIINSTTEINKVFFDSLVKETLNLSFSELCERKDIIRLYHSTLDSFDDKLSVVLKGVGKYEENSVNYNIRKKVKMGKNM